MTEIVFCLFVIAAMVGVSALTGLGLEVVLSRAGYREGVWKSLGLDIHRPRLVDAGLRRPDVPGVERKAIAPAVAREWSGLECSWALEVQPARAGWGYCCG